MIGAQGSVTARYLGVFLNSGSNNSVVNYGEISSGETAVSTNGGDLLVANHGTMSSFRSYTISFFSLSAGNDIREVVNTGVINGPIVNNSPTIYNAAGAEFHLDNSGAILGALRALFSGAQQNFITNTGLITGDILTDSNTTSSPSDNFIANTGLIFGDVTFNSLGSSAVPNTSQVKMTNTGLISGDVAATGLTMMRNIGTIDGDVTLSWNNDIYRGFGGTVLGTIDGGTDNDTYFI
ncbi:hypothetical protein, partial [Sulfitobacter sp.]|uniref:hypothetical protein n=1 Tax=Sulfitobacter sp. TaxID=1903071 RepID=UPI00300314BD